MSNRYNLTPILIREFALEYLFINKEATAAQINDAIKKDPDTHLDTNVKKVTQALMNSPFFGCYKKNRLNIYFLKPEVRKEIEG